MAITIQTAAGPKVLADAEATAVCQASHDEHWSREYTYTSTRDDPDHKAHSLAKRHTIDVSTVVFGEAYPGEHAYAGDGVTVIPPRKIPPKRDPQRLQDVTDRKVERKQ